MLSYFKRVLIAILVTAFFCTPFVANASEIDATLQTVSNSAYISELCSEGNRAAGVTVLSYDSSNGLLRFSNRNYRKLTAEKREDFMEAALTYVSKMPDNASAKMKNSVYNFIAQQDEAVSAAMKYLKVNAGADLVEAEKWFSYISGFISTVFGVLCILIFMFLGFSIILDIFYLVIPPFQALLDSTGDETKKPWGISREAYMSVQEAEKSDEYKSVVSMYLTRRIKVIIVVAIAITYLVSGKIYDIVVWFADSFS